VTDEFDPLRELRPDRVRPDNPGDPGVFEREKERLMSIIEETDPQVSTTGRIPGIYPRLAYRDERAALDYLTRVFGLVEIREARMESEDSFLAWLRLDRGLVMIGRANADVHRIHSPLDLGATSVMMNVDVHDIDAHYARAVAEGADITMELGTPSTGPAATRPPTSRVTAGTSPSPSPASAPAAAPSPTTTPEPAVATPGIVG
jgi:uncharacterized glyoxalase superfamily protein PhnB